MKALIKSVEDKFTVVGDANQQFKDKKAVLLQGTLWENSIVATMPGWRTDFLTQMGFAVPDTIKSYERDHRAFIPPDKAASALDDADVLIWSTESDADQAGLLANPAVAELRATKQNRNVFTGKDLAGAIAFSSVLSYPVVADQLPPLLAKALG
jgi:iron complex transport system substrate-binding protein